MSKVDALVEQKAIFGGFSRSGTTMLRGLLCNSPETMANTRECSYLRALVEAYSLATTKPFIMHAKDYFETTEALLSCHRQILMYIFHLDEKFGGGVPVQEPKLSMFYRELALLMPKAILYWFGILEIL